MKYSMQGNGIKTRDRSPKIRTPKSKIAGKLYCLLKLILGLLPDVKDLFTSRLKIYIILV